MSRRVVAVGTRTQLFVDDFLIAESEGVSERLHAMTRLPEPVLQAAAPWERPAVGGTVGGAERALRYRAGPISDVVPEPGGVPGLAAGGPGVPVLRRVA